MIGVDETQVQTLAEGWEFETEDVDEAVCIADALEMDLPTFVGIVDEIVKQLEGQRDRIDPSMNSASYIMYCYARAQAGLPLN